MADKDLIGARQFGRFVVQRRLGNGANSSIFEVIDSRDNQTYALKRIVKRNSSDDRFFDQAENEFKIAQQIAHPSIRQMHEVIRLRSLFRLKEMHLVMEMFYGQTLETHQPVLMRNVVRVFIQTAGGLHAMHDAGFIHADIKPNNILVGPDGRVKIIDLGQSCPTGTIKQRIQGTPDYIAPEQVHRRPIDRRTDVFNVGATLYWVLTKQHVPTVLPKTQPGREIALVSSSAVRPPDQINPKVPPALSRLVMDCVNVNPNDRPADMKVVAHRLEMIDMILAKQQPNRTTSPQPAPPGNSDSGQWQGQSNAPRRQDDDTIDLSGHELEAV